ncbi:hypothetical protein JST97_21060 [bacterium]|nr:hypothetical protein [bacterium]
MRRLFLVWLCSLSLPGIPAHRLSLLEVLRRADWVGRVEVLSVRPEKGDYGSGLTFEVRCLSTVRGQPPRSPIHYWEAWPQQSPDGKMEAPIWTGSSLERKVVPGNTVYALTDGRALLRLEESLP